MKSLAIGAVSVLFASLAHADMDCNKGAPWRLPLTPSGFSTVEAPIKIDGKDGQMVLICNCTADVAGKNTGVWVRASSEVAVRRARRDAVPAPTPSKAAAGGGTNAYYLPGKSCTLAGTATIILAPTDAVETWGWFQPQP